MIRLLSIVIILVFFCPVYGQRTKEMETVIQKGHAEAVKSIALSPDGGYLLSASRDKSIILWDYNTGFQVRSFLGHESTVNSLSFDSSGKTFVSGSTDKTARLWDVRSGKELNKWTFQDYVTDVSLSPGGKFLAVGGYDWVVTIIDLESADTLKTIKSAPDKGMGYGVEVEFSPDGSLLALGEDNRTARLFSVGDWQEVHRFRPEKGTCGGCGTIVKFSPDGSKLLKASNNGPAVVFDVFSGNEIGTLLSETDDVSGLSFSESTIAITDEFSLRRFNASTLRKTDSLGGFEKQLNAVIVDEENRILLAGDDKMISRLDADMDLLDQFSGILHLDDSSKMPYDLSSYWERYIALYLKYLPTTALDPAGDRLIRMRTGNKARIWDLAENRIKRDYNAYDGIVTALAQGKSNQRIILGTTQGELFYWENGEIEPKFKINAHREPVFDVELSNDERFFASCSWDGLINIYETATGERVQRIDLGNVSAYDIQFTSNAAYLIVSKLDKKLELYELNTGRAVREFVGHTGIVSEIKLGADGYFFTSSWDGSIIRWSLSSDLIDTQFRHDHGAVYDIEVLDEQLVSVGADRKVYVWDISNSSQPRQLLESHSAEISGVDIGMEKMITTDVDGIVKIWDYQNLKEQYEHIQIGSSDWMIKTPKGFFTGTEGAMVNIHFVDGMKSYSADQFFDQFYKPDLLNNTEDSDREDLKGAIDRNPPLEVKIAGLQVAGGKKADLMVKLDGRRNELKELKIFHNGKRLVFNSEPKFKEGIFQFESQLVAGTNEFKVIATNKGNIDSAPSTWDCLSETAKPSSTCHVLTIGINEYANGKLNLNYARSDASAFSTDLKKLTRDLFQDIKITEVYDKDANKHNIREAIRDISDQISVNDVFVMYFAGHGSFLNGEFYLIPTEAKRLYDEKELQQGALSASELQLLLSDIKALKQLIIMDACQSGASVELLARRGALEEKAMAQLSRSSGIHVMASAGSEQFATEFSQIGHGLFTYVLLEALSGKADGAPKDGKVTIYELKSYLDARVPEKSAELKGSPQYPYTFSRGNDFPIVLVKE